ncbi:hypothetical protein WSM22_05530 [Cytophagales bacterium WSM2-2]|nr:hypothetical protein WSM22_05530 [Cytophagales bacterium WSM2-2]
MLRNYISLFIAVAVLSEVTAQSRAIDSIRQVAQHGSGKQRADALNAYGYIQLSYDYQESLKQIEEAYAFSEKLSYKKGLAEAVMYKGIIELSAGRDSLALARFRQGLKILEKEDHTTQGRILASIGVVHQITDRLDSASIYYQRSYLLLKDSLNPLYLSYLYLNLAEYSKLKNDQSFQLMYLTKSWEIRKHLAEKHPMIWAGISLASYYLDKSDYKKATSYIDECKTALGKDTIDNEEISIIYKYQAIVAANRGNHTLALELFAKAKKFYERNPFPWDLVNLLGEIGYLQGQVSNYETSLKYFYQALQLAEKNRYRRQVAMLHFRIARVYYLMEQNALAEEFSRKSLDYSVAQGLEKEEAYVLNQLALLAGRKGQFKEALEYFDRALELRRKNGNVIGEAGIYGNMGDLYEKMNEYKKAEEFMSKALAIAEQADYAMGKCYSYQAIGQLYLKTKDYQKARYYLDKGEAFARKIGYQDVLSRVYKNKRDLLRAIGDYRKAAEYTERYETLKDSIFNSNMSNRILTLQHDFELDQKDNEIKILSQERQLQRDRLALQQAEIDRQRIIIIVGILISIVGGIASYIIFGLYKKVKRLNIEISEQNEEITAQSEELKEANEVLGNLNREISGQKEQIEEQAEELTLSNHTIARINEGLEEKIKARTSELKEAYRELDTFFYRSSHDFRRPLTTFMGLAEVAKVMVKEKPALELFEKVNETARNLDKMLAKLQSVSASSSEDLTYGEIFFEDIIQAEIHHFQDEILKKKIQVISEVEIKQPFYSYPLLIKNVIQNLIENSIVFANDQKPVIKISVLYKGKELQLQVSDNGQGIDPAYLPRITEMYFRANERSTGNGLGLYIVKKMLDRMDGHIDIASELGKGTTITILFPVTIR